MNLMKIHYTSKAHKIKSLIQLTGSAPRNVSKLICRI